MPRKVFVANEILTAADVNTNLMDQAVMVFDDSAARGSAIPTPSEGMVTYLKDTDAVQKFDGSNFVSIVPENSGLVLTGSATFSGVVSQSLNDVFSANFRHYRIVMELVTSEGATVVKARMRASGSDNTTANYTENRFEVSDTSLVGVRNTGVTSAEIAVGTTGGSFASVDMFTPFIDSATRWRSVTNRAGNIIRDCASVLAANVTADGLTIFPSAGTMSGRIAVYGYRSS